MSGGYQGNGTFNFTYSWTNDAANGIPITASRMDTQFNDAVNGFDLVICRDGQSTISNDIPWGGFRLTGLGAATTTGDALSYGGTATLGNTSISGTLGVSGITTLAGNLVGQALVDISSSTAGQIKFATAGANPSTDVNTLDNYQEGTFTFVDASGQGVTITNRNCTYILIGKTCFISAAATFGSSAVATAAAWGGLPFTVKNVTGNGAAGIIFGRANTCVIPAAGNAFINFFTTAGSVVSDSDISTLDIRFQFHYEIA